MKQMPDQCADMCWTDPPYNVGKDYGTYKDNLLADDYLAWCFSLVGEMKRISGNRMCVFVPQITKLAWWNILGLDYQEIILSWSPEGTYRGNFINQFSTLLTNIKPQIYTKNVWHNCQMSGLGYFFRENNYGHPGYTSEDITGRVINAFSLPGQIVCDPCAGTGTSGAEAVKKGRKYILIEIDPGYCGLARKRIALAREQPDLFRKPETVKQGELI